jgi:Tol biopolymer transport system component
VNSLANALASEHALDPDAMIRSTSIRSTTERPSMRALASPIAALALVAACGTVSDPGGGDDDDGPDASTPTTPDADPSAPDAGPTPDASPPPATCNSLLAYAQREDVFVAPLDGVGPVNVSSHPQNDSSPAWLPDGRVLFVSRRAGQFDVWRVNQQGREPTNLTEGIAGTVLRFGVSRDGTRLAFTQTITQPSVATQTWVMNTDGTGAREVGPINVNTPIVWSPDGTRFAFVDFDPTRTSNLVLVDVSSTPRTTTLAEGVTAITTGAWSYDGSALVFARGGDIWRVPAAGGEATNLTPVTSSTESRPHWTPDGEVVFSSNRPGHGIFKTPGAGGEAVPLTTPPPTASDYVVQVGADQVTVLFTRVDSERNGTNTIGFAKLDATTISTPFTVADTNLTEPVWSPCLPD